MGKKQDSPLNSQIKSKRGIIKRKEMFNQLSTIQEEKIKKTKNQINLDSKIDNHQFQRIQEEQDQSKIQENFKGQNKNGAKVQQICQAVNRLFAKNKIGVKNAFQVPIIDLQTLDDYKTMQSQNSWKVLSSTLQNDYKIYGYRVDAIHSITYKILNIMSRATIQQESLAKLQNNIKREQPSNENLIGQYFNDLSLNLANQIQIDSTKNQLQKNRENIDIKMMEYVCSSDPILERTKRLFDQPGLKGLLMNSINISKNLLLPLNSSLTTQNYSHVIDSKDHIQVKLIDHPLQVFESVQKLKYQISDITQEEHEYLSKAQVDSLWKKAKNNKFEGWAQENHHYYLIDQQNNFQMIDQNVQNKPYYQNQSFKQISDFIKIKKPIKNKFDNTNFQMELLGAKWLNQIDRKYLGFKSNSNIMNNKGTENKVKNQRDQDYIDFNFQQQDRMKILKKQSEKMEFKQDIQDKFLMPVKLEKQFKIQKILTLREEPQEQALLIVQQALIDQDQTFLQKQIDIKRQNLSIKETKQKIFSQIRNKKKSYFSQAYNRFNQEQSEISPALCFLTLLHLANQNNLHFKNIQNEEDFQIIKQKQHKRPIIMQVQSFE